MTTSRTPPQKTAADHGESTVRRRYNACAAFFDRFVGHAVLALVMRSAIAAVFLLSGRTKVEGLITVTDAAVSLFRDEYKFPLVSPQLAAHLAAYAEHVLPVLLVLGLFTRGAALALLGMTAVIQVLVYPDAWPTHLTWAGPLLYLVARGGGNLAVDRWLGLK